MRRLHKITGGGGTNGPRAGVPRANGRAIVDDAGEYYPLGLTFMWSLQGARNEPDRYRQNLEWAAAHGFDYKRPLYEVGWNEPLRIDPATFPDHLAAVARDLESAWALGIRGGITLSGKGTGYDLRRLARDVAGVIADGRAQMVLLVEQQNEYSNGGDALDTLEAMARELTSRIPNLVALSTPANQTEADAINARLGAVAGGRGVYIIHTERNADADHGWRDVRQAYDFHTYRSFSGADWEGPGPGSSGSQNTNRLQLAMKRALAIACGAPIFTLHTGTGVYGDGKPASTGPRPPNFWEIENIEAIVDAVRGIIELLPPGLPNWTVANTNWVPPNPVAPFQPHHHWEGDDEKLDGEYNNGVNRAYAALGPDGAWIQLPCGVRERVTLRASYPLWNVTVYDPLERRPVPGFEGLSFNAGDEMTLGGGPWLDPNVAYIIRGTR
jgi:hypothetical protein